MDPQLEPVLQQRLQHEHHLRVFRIAGRLGIDGVAINFDPLRAAHDLEGLHMIRGLHQYPKRRTRREPPGGGAHPSPSAAARGLDGRGFELWPRCLSQHCDSGDRNQRRGGYSRERMRRGSRPRDSEQPRHPVHQRTAGRRHRGLLVRVLCGPNLRQGARQAGCVAGDRYRCVVAAHFPLGAHLAGHPPHRGMIE